MNTELLDKLKELSKREISLSDLCKMLNLNEYEILGLVVELRKEGINITTKQKDDDIYMFNEGEKEPLNDNTYSFQTDNNHEIKLAVISDTRLGSKSQQLSILNDIYANAKELGITHVIHCGNISEGLYPTDSKYTHTLFLEDTLKQAQYIIDKYPQVDGIKTYFITGVKDGTHLKTNKINIGKRISDMREDMIYLGENTCTIDIDKIKMLILNLNLGKTYTSSYRPQQIINSFRSEDKPNILLYGGLLQMEKFTQRDVQCITVPSVTATTQEMIEKRYSNTIGVWYITVKANEKGKLSSITAMTSPYYLTNKEDYIKAKVLKLTKEVK